jgi:hypothetical protein
MISLKELCAAPLGLAVSFCSNELQCFWLLKINIALIFVPLFIFIHTSPRFADCKGRTFILILQKNLKIFSPTLISD